MGTSGISECYSLVANTLQKHRWFFNCKGTSEGWHTTHHHARSLTFYHYYETLDALLAELQMELSAGFLERIKDYELPKDLDKVNREFFLFSAEQGLAYEKITCSVTYHSIRDEMVGDVNDEGWGKSKKYQNLSEFEKKLLMGFVNNAVLTAYRQWVEDGKETPLEEVIEMTNRIVLGGVNGFFK